MEALLIELPDVANKNIGCPVKFEYQINNKVFGIKMSQIFHQATLPGERG